MAASLSRKFLAGLGLSPEQQDAVVEQHQAVLSDVKAELEELRAAQADITAVQKQLDEANKAAKSSSVYKSELEDLRAEFDAYKQKQRAAETLGAKKAAYTDLLRQAGISDKRAASIVKITDFDGMEVDENGKLAKADELSAAIQSDWADFIQHKERVGAPTVTPPATNPNATTMTKEQIMAIKDTAKRQAAMKANPGLFGISVDF